VLFLSLNSSGNTSKCITTCTHITVVFWFWYNFALCRHNHINYIFYLTQLHQ